MTVFEAFMNSQIGKKDAELNRLRDANTELALQNGELRDALRDLLSWALGTLHPNARDNPTYPEIAEAKRLLK